MEKYRSTTETVGSMEVTTIHLTNEQKKRLSVSAAAFEWISTTPEKRTFYMKVRRWFHRIREWF